MALDLTHYKATKKPKNKEDHYFSKEFSDEDINIYSLHKYFQQIPDMEFLHTVFFLKNASDKKYKMNSQKENGYKKGTVSYLVGTPEENENELKIIENNKQIKRSQAWFSTASETNKQNKISYAFASYSKTILSTGLYVNEAGYQRKCMNNQFFEHYTKDFYLDKESFDKLASYVLKEGCIEAVKNIEHNFINNFEEGKSILCVSS